MIKVFEIEISLDSVESLSSLLHLIQEGIDEGATSFSLKIAENSTIEMNLLTTNNKEDENNN